MDVAKDRLECKKAAAQSSSVYFGVRTAAGVAVVEVIDGHQGSRSGLSTSVRRRTFPMSVKVRLPIRG